MSMLTTQVDRLRETVSHIRDTFVYTDLDGVPRIPPTARDIASQIEEAADTIEDLRERLTEGQTCSNNDHSGYGFRCSICGHRAANAGEIDTTEWCYCPSCGRKVNW